MLKKGKDTFLYSVFTIIFYSFLPIQFICFRSMLVIKQFTEQHLIIGSLVFLIRKVFIAGVDLFSMSWCILVIESSGKVYPFTADAVLYQDMKETLSSEKGIGLYGMRFLGGVTDVHDKRITPVREQVQHLIANLADGEPLDLEKELQLLS